MVEFNVPEPRQIREWYARVPPGPYMREELAETFIKKRDLAGHPAAFAKVMRHMSDPCTRLRYNTLRRLPHITVPTLVIWGADDRVNTWAEVGKPTADGIPGARCIVYEGVGHAVPWETPERFCRDVLDFLTE
jgi:pimeloyl-ACP methyl ester carboxylesterase